MPLPIDISVPGAAAPISFQAGLTTVIVGANGSGKTKLAVEFEKQLGLTAHRIAAQRILSLDPAVEKISEEGARAALRFGNAKPMNWGGELKARDSVRWGYSQPGFTLNDTGPLLQVLFAEQTTTAVNAYNAAEEGTPIVPRITFLRRLREIFNRVLPTRSLTTSADEILVTATDVEGGQPYSITEMSDGEKAVFYMIGQTLVADEGSVFIMDEPEIHVHRSILSRLWDELESARPDCAFLLITHDLEFAASRAGNKHVVRSYAPASGWAIEDVPEAEGFSENLITLILGSRKPILFVEGEHGSLDVAFYRACYPTWTVVPRGSCESVIHSVVTLRHNQAFTRLQCAGLVDADGHNQLDRDTLAANDIQVLPVSEIENLLLLPNISRAILEMNEFQGNELEQRLETLKSAILDDARDTKNASEVVLRYCRRRIDRNLKQIDFSADKSVADLVASYAIRTRDLDVSQLATEMETQISAAVDAGDLAALLAIYDRKKALLALASSKLLNWKVDVFSGWVTRAIRSTQNDRLRQAVRDVLPELVPA